MPTRRSTPQPPATRARAGGAVLLGLALALVAAPRVADAKLGDGIKVGPGRLKLGVDADLRFDSNAGLGFGSGPSTQVPALIARGRPSFALDIPGESWTARAGGGVDWNQYVAIGGGSTNLAAASFLGANLSGALSLAPQGAFGGDVNVGFTRSDRISVAAVTSGGLSNSGDLRGRLRYRPGGGDNGSALEFGGWYALGFDLLSPQVPGITSAAAGCSSAACDTNQLSGFSWLSNRVGFDAKYRPFPKTGFTLELDSGLRNYPYFASNPVINIDSVPIRAMVGFGTLLTTRFFFSTKVGYSALLFSGPNVGVLKSAFEQNVAGQLEFGLRIAESIEGRLGYLRSLEATSGDYGSFLLNRGYFDFRGQFSRLLAAAGLSADFLAFGLRAADTETTRRADFVLNLNGQLEYQILDWMRVVGGVRFALRDSNATTVNGSYNRFAASIGLSTLF